MKKINFSFFIKNSRGMHCYIRNARFVHTRPVSFSGAGRSFLCRARKSKIGQVTLEYFILFTAFALLCLLSLSSVFYFARYRAQEFYQRKAVEMNLGSEY